MHFNEVKDILTILRINYPQSFYRFSKEDGEAFLNLWAEAFKDDPAELVAGAVKSIIYSDVREFAPNIAQVKNKMAELLNAGNEVSEQEAWNLVYKAICNSIHDSEKEFNKLPQTIQRVVGSPAMLKEWATTNSDEVNTVIASNFMRSYRVRIKAEKDEMLLPNEVRTMLQARNKVAIDNTVDKLVLSLKTS